MDGTLQDPLIGQLLDGRYRVEELIAVGGMATVYRGLDTRLDRVLALKVMHTSLAQDAAFVARFIREAKSVARLDHPNIVGVLDQGTDGPYVYLAMEYVAGCTLRDLLRDRGALQPRAALDIAEPLLAGLAAAHRAGLVHRDIKPENVLIGDDGRVKVADFGLVRGADGQTSATTGSLLGTVSYLAPEQIEGREVDARTDIYACGLLLYEMLTGAKPRAGDSAAQVLFAHVNEDVPPPSLAVPGLPAALDALVTRSAAREPGTRPADAAAMLSLLRGARAGLSPAQLDAVPPAARQAGAGAGAPAGAEDSTRIVPLPPGVRPARAVAEEPPFGRAYAGAPAREEAPRGITGGPGAPGVPGVTEGVSRTARIELPPLPPPDEPPGHAPGAGRGRRLPRRGVLSLVLGALLALGVGVGIWYINSGQFLRTPGVYGLAQEEAEQELRDAGLKVRVAEEFSDTVDPGHVISTDPERGARVRRNATVTITVSQGPRVAEVPNLRGIPLEEAEEQLAEAGLSAGEVDWEFSGEVPRGSVLRTDPEAGAERRPDSEVNLVVSKGREVRVPDVVGLSRQEAVDRLREAGFEPKVNEERVYSEEDAGHVAAQSPGAGGSAAEGDRITLTLSRGPEQVVVPDVEGMDEDEARDALEEAGFEVTVRRLFFTGTVFNQSVDPGDRAPRGSTITIWVR
ncbi:Stk1 family PASTA domain-containing Ser/Thr kinase [Streptomyces hoynatensis]|uniref:non-specific serine/threonine protein kinase n=1 Tax=Streptomyces hoynatensis TaxID=1141874 RepID=A0A3A9Z1F8_9ACTN|nr:Stk1 family PASTA domain-containing Ser/Thr kinase [Streptomyces hoynatensis]RKN42282.1 Stk1 family PASTA domain-containing Ser/Thr kinase [Streptomyces hoynatensis]